MTDLRATEQVHFNNHQHVGSVYVRCKDCLTFGTPMPGEYQCGNCSSFNTMSYLPPCCIREARAETIEECAKIIHDEIDQVRYPSIERAEKRVRALKP